jgi:hypothetical protein
VEKEMIEKSRSVHLLFEGLDTKARSVAETRRGITVRLEEST